MTFSTKVRGFGPTRALMQLAHKRWADWCQSKADSPTLFKRFLDNNGIHVDWHTASRWWHGETLPSTARIFELKAHGVRGIFEAIFEPALIAGDLSACKRRIAEMRSALEREEHEIREFDRACSRLLARTDGQSFDVDGQADKAARPDDT